MSREENRDVAAVTARISRLESMEAHALLETIYCENTFLIRHFKPTSDKEVPYQTFKIIFTK